MAFVPTTSVFLNCLLLLAAVATAADAVSVTWEKGFRPIYPEAAAYPRAAVQSDGRVQVAFAHRPRSDQSPGEELGQRRCDRRKARSGCAEVIE